MVSVHMGQVGLQMPLRETLGRWRHGLEHGEFPTNRTDAERVPLFVGDDGPPCAVAHLLLAPLLTVLLYALFP